MALMLSIMARMLHDLLLWLRSTRQTRMQEFISFTSRRSVGRHGNLRRLKAWTRTMFSKLRAAWARMTSERAASESDEPNAPAIEYQGYRIRPTPYRAEGQYQTAGIIEKNFPEIGRAHV